MVGGIPMFRKSIIYLILSLLVVLPVLGVFADQVSAASSRVAIIKEMKGTIKVKKAGGSKEFTAFAKMSLNEGDILTTGGSSSAVLQFANGTSEDDKMTVSSSTTMSFSKLSNSKGTSTKVSMFNGSAWVDVKSITSKDDEFSLETPTVIMGVRGTHLLVSVDPETGATHLTVAAGVVNASTKDSDGSKENKDIYPTQNALFTNDKQSGDTEITIAPVDLELLIKQSDTIIVQAILESAAAIIAENEHYVKQYEDNGVPGNLGSTKDDLARFKSNTENLLGAIADQAIKSGVLSQERLDQILAEVQSQSGITVDLTKKNLQLTDEEQKQKEAQRLKDEEAKKQAQEQKKQEEADRKKNEEMLKKLNDERKAKDEANKKAAGEKLKKAEGEYEKQLGTAEKQRYEDAKKQREPEKQASSFPSPTPAGPQSPIISNHAPIAVGRALEFSYNSPYTFNLGASDVDGDNLTYILGVPTHGTITSLANGKFSFTPPSTEFYSSVSFNFKVNDGKTDSDAVTVTINIVEPDEVTLIDGITEMSIDSSENLTLNQMFYNSFYVNSEQVIDELSMILNVEAPVVSIGITARDGSVVSAYWNAGSNGENANLSLTDLQPGLNSYTLYLYDNLVNTIETINLAVINGPNVIYGLTSWNSWESDVPMQWFPDNELEDIYYGSAYHTDSNSSVNLRMFFEYGRVIDVQLVQDPDMPNTMTSNIDTLNLSVISFYQFVLNDFSEQGVYHYNLIVTNNNNDKYVYDLFLDYGTTPP
jgi:hypothetical protein